jgi:hypothetical protein
MKDPKKAASRQRGPHQKTVFKTSLMFAPSSVDALIDQPWTQERSAAVDRWLAKHSVWEGA